MSLLRSRWAAVGASVAVAAGAGGIGLASAGLDSGDRPVTVTVEPERILDTRVDLGLAGPFVGGAPRDLQVTGDVAVASGGTATVVPPDAVAVLVNVTVVNPSSAGFLSLRPAGASGVPSTSTVNFLLPGTIEPNAATVDLGQGGKVQIYVNTAAAGGIAEVLVDVVGYTVDHTHDDRYAPREVVESLSPWGFIPSIDDSIAATNGCATSSKGILITRPLDVPVGAELVSVVAKVYSANQGDPYSVRVRRSAVTSSGNQATDIASASGGTNTGVPTVTTHTLLTPGLEIVTKNESFQIDFSPSSDFMPASNGVCYIDATYVLPEP